MEQKLKLKEQMFDFEVTPDWWLCVVGVYPEDDKCDESIKDDFFVFRSDEPDAAHRLLTCVMNRDYVNMGYNIKGYDNIILNAVANGFEPRDIKRISDLIIHPELGATSYEYSRLVGMSHARFTDFVYQDMLDDNTGSLKEKESCMQLDIRESDIPFDKCDLTEAEKQEMITYCKHDVWSSMQFYKVILKPFIATKLLVGRVFGISMETCYKSTNATLSGKALGAVKSTFPDANRQDIEIPDGLKSYITYSLPKEIIDRICKSPEKFDTPLFGNLVSYSNGGIHSVPLDPMPKKRKIEACNNVIASANDEWALVNVDASSFYPATMIAWKTLSRAVQQPDKFAEMYHARLKFKEVIEPFEEKYGKRTDLAPAEEYAYYKKCKETSQAYKLILNTTYGASGNKYLALYDPYMTTKTCRLGQLILTSLANNIYNTIGKDNVIILQTNTDGVLCYVRREYLPLLHQLGDAFTEVTHILLEFEEEGRIFQRDVNNYIMVKRSGREKTKGGYFVTDMQQPGYNRVRPLNMYVCREAMIQYMLTGKDIVEHIYNETDLSKFVIACNKGNGSGMVREFTDGTLDQPLHNCNRAYASLTKRFGETFVLRNMKGELKKYKSPGCPPHCALVNDALPKYDFNEIRKDIDYMWYITETLEMLSDEWHQCDGAKIVKYNLLSE